MLGAKSRDAARLVEEFGWNYFGVDWGSRIQVLLKKGGKNFRLTKNPRARTKVCASLNKKKLNKKLLWPRTEITLHLLKYGSLCFTRLPLEQVS
jgi:hypothetical protein